MSDDINTAAFLAQTQNMYVVPNTDYYDNNPSPIIQPYAQYGFDWPRLETGIIIDHETKSFINMFDDEDGEYADLYSDVSNLAPSAPIEEDYKEPDGWEPLDDSRNEDFEEYDHIDAMGTQFKEYVKQLDKHESPFSKEAKHFVKTYKNEILKGGAMVSASILAGVGIQQLTKKKGKSKK